MTTVEERIAALEEEVAQLRAIIEAHMPLDEGAEDAEAAD